MTSPMRGMFFEEFNLGDIFSSVGRTITEGDIVTFAGLSGDYNQIHTDKEFAEKTIYERRIAHGLLGLSVVSGLAARLGFGEGTTIALRSIEWKYKHPIQIGDTIRGKFEVVRKRTLPEKEGGMITFGVVVLNQRDQVVQQGKWTILVKKQPQ